VLVLGTSFHSTNEVGIYDSSDQPRSRYFVFGDPYNEDEVIEFLKLYQSSEEQEAHPDVDEQILNKLIDSYHYFKENEGKEEEKKEEVKPDQVNGNQAIEQDPYSLWVLFREVTGFVPLTCWKIIEKDEDYEDTLEERLDRINHEIISEVMVESLLFYKEMSTNQIMSRETQSFLGIARDNYLIKMRSINTGNDIVLNEGEVKGTQRMSWDLRYASCLYNNKKKYMSTPIALSGSIAAGLHKVFESIFNFMINYFFRDWLKQDKKMIRPLQLWMNTTFLPALI